MNDLPFDRSYWVEPGRVLAGAYPGDYEPLETRKRMLALLNSGIRTVVSLMEAREESPESRELPAYGKLFYELAERRGVEVAIERHEIHDYSTPSPERMGEIEASIRGSLARDHPVYVHCWGGRGRTGTVVGVHLIRRGLATPENFVDVIADLRRHDPAGGLSPENRAQVQWVRDYFGG